MTNELLVVGLSHRTAPLDLRERLAVSTDRLPQELRNVMRARSIDEGLLISTCNRVELYAASSDTVSAARDARAYLDARAPSGALEGRVYEHRNDEAVHHAFRVTSSLDSMVVGEPQILGQVKEAYDVAAGAGSLGTLLGRCFTRAFSVAKRVRNETGIAKGSVSVSSIAVELAAKIFSHLEHRRVLLVGAGKMSEAAARKLHAKGARLVVVNRDPERAQVLAQSCGGEAEGYERLAQELVHADVVITSTGSDRFVIPSDLMRDVMRARRWKPAFLIDIAVPRDIDPRVGDTDGVFLYDVDDLRQVADENLTARQREAESAEQIVTAEAMDFEQWRRSLQVTPTIVALRQRFHHVVRAELERTMPRLGHLGERDRKALDKMGDAIVNKLLHDPVTELREEADGPDSAQLVDAVRRLFNVPQAHPTDHADTASEGAEDDGRAQEDAAGADVRTEQPGDSLSPASPRDPKPSPHQS